MPCVFLPTLFQPGFEFSLGPTEVPRQLRKLRTPE